jgi:tetratricopeptide (TPR) repeat protein
MIDPQPRRSILAELRRRQVYRTGAMYAAASFVVWQAADIVVPALGLPAAVMRVMVITAIAGFPIALLLAWIYELTPEGIRATSALDAVHGADRPVAPVARRAARRRLAAASAGAAVLVAGAWWAVGDRLVPRGADPDELSLAVFPFAVRGGATFGYLGEGLMDLLSRNLAGAAELQPVDPSLVLRLSGGVEPPDRATAALLARRAGAGRYVLGSLTQAGDQLRIDAALYAVGDEARVPPMRMVQGDTAQLFDLIDRLTAALLADYGSGAASERLVRTAAGTTASLDALKAYLEGEQRFRSGEHADGVDAFRRALGHDSAFALARYRLALSHHMRGEHDIAQRESGRALADAGRLSAHERRIIEAFHAYHEGRVAEAERQLREVIREHPRDLEARLILAELLIQYAPLRAQPLTEAQRLLEEVNEADPRFACIYCQLVIVELAEGDVDGAERWLRLASAARTGDTTRVDNAWDRFGIAARRGDTTEMYAAVAAFDTLPRDLYARTVVGGLGGSGISSGNFGVVEAILQAGEARAVEGADLELLSMRLDLARGAWERANSRIDAYSRQRGSAATLGLRIGLLLLTAPSELRLQAHDTLRRELQRLPAAASDGPDATAAQRLAPAFRHYALGLAASRTGDAAAARVQADSLDRFAVVRPGDAGIARGMAATVRADIALRAGDPRSALDILAAIGTDVPPAVLGAQMTAPHYAARLRAAAYAATAQPEHALRWLRHAVAFYGTPHPQEYGTWHREMARALDALGREDDAAYHYARFVEAWADADPGLQDQVAAARDRLAALRGDRRP